MLTAMNLGNGLLPSVALLALWLVAPSPARSATGSVLVAHGDAWRYRKGASAPPADWRTLPDAALEASWLAGPGGFGYGDGDDATRLDDMEDAYTTLYIRRAFEMGAGVDPVLHLVFAVDYDDGFVAYIDGREIARRNTREAVGTEPPWNTTARQSHEASAGGGADPERFDLGPATAYLAPGPHTLAVMGLNNTRDSTDFSLICDLLLEPDAGAGIQGSIAADTTWSLAGSPYLVTGDVTVEPGATLRIEPGVEVRVAGGARITVRGRLLAEGTADAPLLFAPAAGSSSWGGLAFVDNSAENRVVHARIERANSEGEAVYSSDSILLFESVVWRDMTKQILDLNDSSIILRDCDLPDVAGVELFHFLGFPPEGHALVEGNRFGSSVSGYADVIDFTGGNRPGPILQFLNNVMLGSADDLLDLDSTDAHVEGNIFLNAHRRNTSSSLSHAVTTGKDTGDTSEITVVRNVFYDFDHALLVKGEGFATVVNNTVVGGTIGFVSFNEPGRGQPDGRGAYIDGNIFWNPPGFAAADFVNAPATLDLTIHRSIFPGRAYPGAGNSSVDPLFVNGAAITDVTVDLQLQPDSPARGAGPNGLDMGAFVPAGASISGEPASPTPHADATLTIGGPGIVAFRYRLDDGPYGAEIPIADLATGAPLRLAGLTDGAHQVFVIGKNSAGVYQPLEQAAASRIWIVDTGLDADQDGMPDPWEGDHGLNPGDPADAGSDGDGDGLSALDEYRAGTDPTRAGSALGVAELVPLPHGGMSVQWDAAPGRVYQLEGSAELATWTARGPVIRAAAPRQWIVDGIAGERGFYRLVLLE